MEHPCNIEALVLLGLLVHLLRLAHLEKLLRLLVIAIDVESRRPRSIRSHSLLLLGILMLLVQGLLHLLGDLAILERLVESGLDGLYGARR